MKRALFAATAMFASLLLLAPMAASADSITEGFATWTAEELR